MRAPRRIGRRGATVLVLAALAGTALLFLDLESRAHGGAVAREFFASALNPAFDYETPPPDGAPLYLARLLDAVRRTLVFAAASMSLAIAAALPLALLASEALWSADPARRQRAAAPIRSAVRAAIAGLRSVHELLWALILLAAFGTSPVAAVVALAIPFTGILAKVWAELLDESPTDATSALVACGARPLGAFLAGALPRALPDMAAYAFYRFECAVRSSAVLGFFGFETLGYYLRLSFENLHYRGVWTHLYALVLLVLVFETWSASVRRRFVA